MQSSIDGFVDSSVGAGWGLWDWGPEWTWSPDLREEFNRAIGEVSGILLSRPMYEGGYADHWAAIADSGADDADFRFASRVTRLPKFVVTGQACAPRHDNVTVIAPPLRDAVEAAKSLAGGDLICFGGSEFAASLLRERLVDELQLYVNPGLAGAGHRIFDASMADQSWKAIDATGYDCGIAVLRWAPGSPTGARR
jgi:dihydrofolate reductase